MASTAAADMSALDAICSQIYSIFASRDTLMYYDETNKRTRRMESGRILNTTQDVLDAMLAEQMRNCGDGQTKIKPEKS